MPVTCRKGNTGNANGQETKKFQIWPMLKWPMPPGLSELACYLKYVPLIVKPRYYNAIAIPYSQFDFHGGLSSESLHIITVQIK
jgi:hypothetical protein